MQTNRFILLSCVFSTQCYAVTQNAIEKITVTDKSLNENSVYYVLANQDIVSCASKPSTNIACKPVFTVDGRYCEALTITDDTHSAWSSFYCPSYWAISSLRKIGIKSQSSDFLPDNTLSIGSIIELAQNNTPIIKKGKNKGVLNIEYTNLNLRVGMGNQGLKLDRFANPDDQLIALTLKLDHGRPIYEKYRFQDNREVEVFLKYNMLGNVTGITTTYDNYKGKKQTNMVTYNYRKINKILNIQYPKTEKEH